MCVLEVDFAHKIGCHGNVHREIEKLASDLLSTAIGLLSSLQTGKIGPVDGMVWYGKCRFI